MATDSSSRTSGGGTFVLLFALIALAWAATWIIPQGSYERATGDDGRERVVAGSYAPVAEDASRRLLPHEIPAAIPAGLERAKGVLFFILIVGGAFRVLRETAAAEAAIGGVLTRFGRQRNMLLLTGLTIFAAGSSTIGMAEEYIPFVPILIVFGLGLGLDRTAAVGIVIIGAAIGYGTAVLNPFTLLVAQEICELPPTSGMGLRLLLVVPFVVLAFDHLRRHANRLDRARGEGMAACAPEDIGDHTAAQMFPPLTRRRMVVLAALISSIGVIVYGVQQHEWYLNEMMTVFIVAGIAFGIAGGMNAARIAEYFARGAAELAPTGLLLGFAYAIPVVLERGQVVDTIIYAVSVPLEGLGSTAAAIGMLGVQSFCNLLIPSGSGQAGVTMPIMAAVADLSGVSRQTAVLAFQFGDGLTNMIIPTNVVLLSMLSLAGVTYGQWVRFVWPLLVRMLIVAAMALAVAVWIGYT